MADYFCDHGAYASALGTVPTWGVPQEGDGSSKDAATASSVVSVDLTSITSNAGTFALFGSAAISVGAAASGATLATQIANAINASTVTTGNTTIFPGAPQIRNAFYARATGATLEIMCRIGSTTTNTLGLVWAGTWTAGPPASGTFSGGSGGCWGWFENVAAIGVSSSIAANTYGIHKNKPMVWTAPLSVSTPVYVRTGTNPVLDFAANTNLFKASSNYKLVLIFDTNTIWTSDSATGTFTVNLTATGATDLTVLTGDGSANLASSGTSYVAKRIGGLTVTASFGSTGRSFGVGVQSNYATGTYIGVKFALRSGCPSGCYLYLHCTGSYASVWLVLRNCEFDMSASANTVLPSVLFYAGGYATSTNLSAIGCVFRWALTGLPPDTTPLFNTNAEGNGNIIFEDCAFYSGSSTKLKVITTTTPGTLKLYVLRCVGLNLTGSYTGYVAAFDYAQFITDRRVLQALDQGNSFRYESAAGIVWWKAGNSPPYPTLAASQPDGQPWSEAVEVSSTAAVVTPYTPISLPAFVSISRLATGVRTVVVNLLVPSAITNVMLSKMLDVCASYKDASENGYIDAAAAPLDSAMVWADASGWAGYTARSCTITTSNPVALGAAIVVNVRFISVSPTGGTVTVFVDPEVVVS